MGRERNSKRTIGDAKRNPRIPNSDRQKDRIRMLCYVMNLWLVGVSKQIQENEGAQCMGITINQKQNCVVRNVRSITSNGAKTKDAVKEERIWLEYNNKKKRAKVGNGLEHRSEPSREKMKARMGKE